MPFYMTDHLYDGHAYGFVADIAHPFRDDQLRRLAMIGAQIEIDDAGFDLPQGAYERLREKNIVRVSDLLAMFMLLDRDEEVWLDWIQGIVGRHRVPIQQLMNVMNSLSHLLDNNHGSDNMGRPININAPVAAIPGVNHEVASSLADMEMPNVMHLVGLYLQHDRDIVSFFENLAQIAPESAQLNGNQQNDIIAFLNSAAAVYVSTPRPVFMRPKRRQSARMKV